MNTAISDSAVKLNNKIDGVVAQVANLTTDFIENFKLIKSEVNHAKLAVTQLNNTVTQLQTKTDTQTEQIQKILDDKINSTDKNNNNSSELINRMTNIVIFGIPEADGNISDKQRLDMNRGKVDELVSVVLNNVTPLLGKNCSHKNSSRQKTIIGLLNGLDEQHLHLEQFCTTSTTTKKRSQETVGSVRCDQFYGKVHQRSFQDRPDEATEHHQQQQQQKQQLQQLQQIEMCDEIAVTQQVNHGVSGVPQGQNDNNNSGNNCRDNFIDNEFGTELWREEAVALNEQHEDIEESLSSVTRNKIPTNDKSRPTNKNSASHNVKPINWNPDQESYSISTPPTNQENKNAVLNNKKPINWNQDQESDLISLVKEQDYSKPLSNRSKQHTTDLWDDIVGMMQDRHPELSLAAAAVSNK
ncbi:probable serine/threonine-protein kinase dyrk1 [Aphidius gifuensis]|uniref:probable serine/threonine-protein kinase dyrk1 n=1 Tax=Aphidius gifuensis TaxID=684658 RepID=UPI001CDD42E0|nr:probable serine/threonine-protein kinase dyrk1 [Aphidius gifuensis]